MNTAITAISIVLIALASSSPALAQPFDGPFAGVQAGYEVSDVVNPTTEIGVLAHDDSQGSFTGGIYLGYNKQVAPRIVLGLEGSFDLSAHAAMSGSTAAGLATVDPDWSFDLTARTGYLLDAKTLAYLRGGYTNARIETSQTSGLASLIESENRDGWLAGAGIERQLLPNLSARLEYRYSDLSDEGDQWDRYRVLTGISYRF